MALQLHKVDYDAPQARYAADLRFAMAQNPNVEGFLGRNIATIYYAIGLGQVEDARPGQITLASESWMAACRAPEYGAHGEVVRFVNTPPLAAGENAPTRHSELACWGAVRHYFDPGVRAEMVLGNQPQFHGLILKAKILWVYTEREPCGPDNANCTALLEEVLLAHGEKGLGTPVYYSFYWPDTRNFRGPTMTAKEAAAYAKKYREIGTKAVQVLDQWLLDQAAFPAPNKKSENATARRLASQGRKIAQAAQMPPGYQ